ncbi:MAG: vWA domain-containing protein, partial [Myxococcota bacterium]
KHGHTISPLTPIELIKLHGYAEELVKLDEGYNDDVATYTDHESVDKAIRVFKGAAARCTSDSQVLRDYWALVDEKIGLNAWIVGGFGFLATAAPSSLRASTAAYLHALGSAKMSAGQWGNNFDYFDPFYFNGPVLDTASAGWEVAFKATQLLGEHLRYETEPNHNAWVKSFTKTDITKMADGEFIRFTGDVPGYAPFEPGAGIATPTDGAARAAARVDAVGGVVRWTAKRSNGDQKFDLWGKSTPMLARHVRIAIAGVATALRASISALRAKATLIETKMSDRVAVRAVVRSVADVPATLTDVVLGTPTGKTWAHERTSSRPIEGARLGPSDEIEVTWIIQVDDDGDPPKPEDFHVDIFGHYDGVPDSGWRREPVEQGLRLGTLDDVAAADTDGVPVDLVIVFDITGSMQSSIDSVRGHATKVVETLQRESGDLRLALVGFRDVADDSAAPFEAHTFSGDISGQLARMNEWKAKGGGDTPEDQLAAIKKGIQFWYDNPRPPENQPVKLIVVITDAPAKDPDGESTTIKKIAKAAFEVDPAHIYPIVVGKNPKALDHARELAELSSGKVFVADDGDAVADALIEVVRDGIARHASEIDHSWRPSLTMVRGAALAGGLLVIIGLLMIVLPARRRTSSKNA